jgi:hypothetical protein
MTRMYSDVFNTKEFYIKYDKNVILLKKIIKTINKGKDLMKIRTAMIIKKKKKTLYTKLWSLYFRSHIGLIAQTILWGLGRSTS